MSSPYGWLLSYVTRRPLTSALILVTAIVEPVFYMYALFLSADIIAVLQSGGGWDQIWRIYVVFFPLIVVQVGMFFGSSFFNEVIAHRITTDMTYDLFETLQDRSLTYHDGKDVGEIMSRATNDTRAVNYGLSPGVRMLFGSITVWGVGFYVVYGVEPLFAYAMLVIFIVYLALTISYAKKVAPLSKLSLETLVDVSSIASDSFNGIRDLKAYVSLSRMKRNFAKATATQTRVKEKEGEVGAWFYPDIILRLFILLLIGYATTLLTSGALGIDRFVLLLTTTAMVVAMGEELNWVSFILIQSLTATRRLHEFMNDKDPHYIMDGDVKFEGMSARIEFADVSFRYPGTEVDVLMDLSFTIEDSETLAIIGSPGSGKSTLTKLIQRLYTPTSGEIRLDGIPLSKFENSSLRRNIATVEQDVHLFNDSILENIRFARPDTPLEEVIEVAKIAHAHEFISEFPDGYETLIGDNGVRLSGGQAQRVAIARAIIVNPEILIIDDGASALDAKTEIQIQEAISEILRTRTTIITTHRLAIIAKADRILMLDRGRVIGFGTHEELITRNIEYRKLFEKHFELPPLEVS